MAETNSSPLKEGAHNLLVNCANLATGDRLAIICENPSLGWYDSLVPKVVCETAVNLGLNTTMISVSGPTPDRMLPENAAEALATHDHSLFFARLGDQSRFNLQPTAHPPVMSYTYTANLLASTYGQFNYQAFFDFKLAVDQTYDDSTQIRITCPLGTDITGKYTTKAMETDDVSIKRFPLGIHKPISIDGFSGHVALSKYLVSTGSRNYAPDFAAFDDIVLAQIEGTRIVKFDGPKSSVDKILHHYAMVSELFDIEPMYIHSWHAGIHPGCSFIGDPKHDPNRWGNTIFQNPRVLHFHTCGAQPPGEISWNIIDPTIEIDGTIFWASGKLNSKANKRLKNPLSKWSGLRQLFTKPVDPIGV